MRTERLEGVGSVPVREFMRPRRRLYARAPVPVRTRAGLDSNTRVFWLTPLVLVAALGCNRPQPPAPVQVHPPPQPVGACENISIGGTCTFTGVHVIDPATGAPRLEQPGADGTVVYEIGYASPDGGGLPVSLRVRAAPSDRPALERYYAAHREAPCAGVVIRAPCPPGVMITVTVPPPPVGTVLRPW